MFSKKPLVAPPPPASPSRLSAILALPRRRPYLSAGSAGAAFLATLTLLVLALGDPKAGLPRVVTPLTHPGAELPPGWRQAAGQEAGGEALVTLDQLQFDETAGQAAIYLPGAAFAGGDKALPQAPIAGFQAPGPSGPLPVIAADGRTPSQVYARPFRDSGKPRVALVIGGLGLNAKATREAVETLPPEVTLSFVPYADGLQGWIDLARAHGHEVLLEAPMEPLDYPDNDPGPYTLMAGDPPQETVRRLEWLLSRATGYFGVTNYLGGRFVNSDKGMGAFLGALRQRGLAFVDDGLALKRSGGGAPRASANAIIDADLDSAAIDRQLAALEAAAVRDGAALGSGFAYPVTLQQVQAWTASLQGRGYALAPASAVMTRR